MSERTAILFFTRSWRDEIQHKRFHSRQKTSGQIANHLIQRTKRVLNQSGYPVFEITSNNQHGATPNARFDHAIKQVFQAGFERVIAVGNDCPQLTVADLRQADELLEQKTMVLGPDFRGGTYLFAVKRASYHSQMILELPWGTRRFLKGILHQTGRQHIALLHSLTDINDFVDLLRRKINPVRKALLKAFLSAFRDQHEIWPDLSESSIYLSYQPIIGRAPPEG